jgi:hypothetical protein
MIARQKNRDMTGSPPRTDRQAVRKGREASSPTTPREP